MDFAEWAFPRCVVVGAVGGSAYATAVRSSGDALEGAAIGAFGGAVVWTIPIWGPPVALGVAIGAAYRRLAPPK
jgi:hypothetical protein